MEVGDFKQVFELLGVNFEQLVTLLGGTFLVVKAIKNKVGEKLYGIWTDLLAIGVAGGFGYLVMFKPQLGQWGTLIALVFVVWLMASGTHATVKK